MAGIPRPRTSAAPKPLEQYEHKDKERLNNPPVGLVNKETDRVAEQKTRPYAYDPHLDPQLQWDGKPEARLEDALATLAAWERQNTETLAQLQKALTDGDTAKATELAGKLADGQKESAKARQRLESLRQPYLNWAGKAERTSFEIPTVSLHVHERIDPRRIIETVRKEPDTGGQMSLFEEKKRPIREAVEFYKHRENWSNRLIAGDSLLVMNSLLEKEGMGGKVQMVYFDPPYGIKYGSNFQPFVNKRDVKDGSDQDLTAEPEMLKAFRDTWELGLHSYLTYLRDRLYLAKQLLAESGSIFVQISDENVHHVRELMDDVFGAKNFCSVITYRTSVPLTSVGLAGVTDYLIWYAKDKNHYKFRDLFVARETGDKSRYTNVELSDGTRRTLTADEKSDLSLVPHGSKIYGLMDLASSGYTPSCIFDFQYNGTVYKTSSGKSWKTNKTGMEALVKARRISDSGKTIRYIIFLDDFPVTKLTNFWHDTTGELDKDYVVQTHTKVLQRCLLMTSDPGDLVIDITCGSGTTAYVAEQWGRRWVTCDTSRVATTLAKQRLMTANFDYYELLHPTEGVGSGFRYKTVPHITLKSIANNEPAPQETLYDQPVPDSRKRRVTGPFTVEAVPAPVAVSFDEFEEADAPPEEADTSIARSGETLRQSEWRDELLRTGVRGKAGNRIEFTRVEPLSGAHYLQAEAETREDVPKRVVCCFGPEHAPLEQRTVELALEEVGLLMPRPAIVLFCAFQFDEEAAKDIDETRWSGVTLLKAQMNADLLTEDLKKKRASNESFWLIGQPDVTLRRIPTGDDAGKVQVEVIGFDYYNPKTGTVESGGRGDIAMWMLDPDYDGRSLFPSQVFFPMAGAKEGWATLAKNLKAEIDEEKIAQFGGTVSLPFTPGRAVAVKIIDARGIESLKILRM